MSISRRNVTSFNMVVDYITFKEKMGRNLCVDSRVFNINIINFSGFSGTPRPMYCWPVPVTAPVGCGKFRQETARLSRDTA